jgi:hypothetical protein
MPTSAEVSRDEHEPLLKADIPEQPYLVVLDVSPEDGVEDQCLESTPRTEPEITGTDTSFHVALMVLALVSLALLGLLIKGLLDAGDVKVRRSTSRMCGRLTMVRFASSTSGKRSGALWVVG